MADYPTSLDVLTNPVASDPLDDPSHSAQHSTANDILEELEEKLGVGASTPGVGKELIGTTGAATSWVDNTRTKGARFFEAHATLSDRGSIYFPRDATLIGWRVENDIAGSVTFDVLTDASNDPPSAPTDSITASDKPKTTSARKATGSCSGWTTSVAAGTTLYIIVDTTATGGIRWSDVRLVFKLVG